MVGSRSGRGGHRARPAGVGSVEERSTSLRGRGSCEFDTADRLGSFEEERNPGRQLDVVGSPLVAQGDLAVRRLGDSHDVVAQVDSEGKAGVGRIVEGLQPATNRHQKERFVSDLIARACLRPCEEEGDSC